METTEYVGISLIRVIKELAGRVRILEETIRGDEGLKKRFQDQLRYRAAYEEDEYGQLVNELKSVLERLAELETGDDQA
jgi:hypothetical protein